MTKKIEILWHLSPSNQPDVAGRCNCFFLAREISCTRRTDIMGVQPLCSRPEIPEAYAVLAKRVERGLKSQMPWKGEGVGLEVGQVGKGSERREGGGDLKSKVH